MPSSGGASLRSELRLDDDWDAFLYRTLVQAAFRHLMPPPRRRLLTSEPLSKQASSDSGRRSWQPSRTVEVASPARRGVPRHRLRPQLPVCLQSRAKRPPSLGATARLSARSIVTRARCSTRTTHHGVGKSPSRIYDAGLGATRACQNLALPTPM